MVCDRKRDKEREKKSVHVLVRGVCVKESEIESPGRGLFLVSAPRSSSPKAAHEAAESISEKLKPSYCSSSRIGVIFFPRPCT